MVDMLTIPNILSFLRLPLALAFLQGNIGLRVAAIIIAGLTDLLDGFLARRFGQSSRLGTILDPLTDKIFVLMALVVFVSENKLSIPEALTMMSRDFSVVAFGAYLLVKGSFSLYKIEAIWCGKIFTTLQLFALLCLALGVTLPVWFYGLFVILGGLALIELKSSERSS